MCQSGVGDGMGLPGAGAGPIPAAGRSETSFVAPAAACRLRAMAKTGEVDPAANPAAGIRAPTDKAIRPPTMIEIRQLTRTFGDKVAVDHLDMVVRPGDILGFLGPNGAGKTTTVKILACMIAPSGGCARVAGFDVTQEPMEVKRRIGYVPEAGALYETLTAGEYLTMVANLRGLERGRVERRVPELLDLFGILDARDLRLAQHSKGMKQKVLISSALIGNPEVLYLDEPLAGLDANAALVVKHLLRELASQGRTILFCSHILDVVERICSRIVIIDGGRKVAEGSAAGIAADAGAATLESAFARLTGVRDAGDVTRGLLSALEDDETPGDAG